MDTKETATQESKQPTDISEIKQKSLLTGKVLKTSLAGAIVDIGLDTPGVIHISQLQEKNTNRVKDVVNPGDKVNVWVRRVEPKRNRIELTMIEPLPLEWRELKRGMVVSGKVTRLEDFGAFVDIGTERPGLVHISELTHAYIKSPGDIVKVGDEVEVKILDVNRRKKQIKLSMKALEENPVKVSKKNKRPRKKVSKPKKAKEKPAPTAMEMALREAMERSQTKEDDTTESMPESSIVDADKERGDILSRTLENKVRTES